MIRNMRSSQNISISCGSVEPVPLTLDPNYDLCIATRIQIHSSAKSIGVIEVEVDHSYMSNPTEVTEVSTLDEMYSEIGNQ